MKHSLIIESALFSAGKPLAIKEFQLATNLTEQEIKNAIESLIKEYKKRETSLEITKVGEKYAMQVKAEFTQHATKLAKMEIPKKLLRTLALIAYHQPIKQVELQKMVGSIVYEHVGELHNLGLIRTREEGRTKLLYTTESFAEYFGIDTIKKKEIKEYLAKKVGITIEKKRKKKEISAEVKEENMEEKSKSEEILEEKEEGIENAEENKEI